MVARRFLFAVSLQKWDSKGTMSPQKTARSLCYLCPLVWGNPLIAYTVCFAYLRETTFLAPPPSCSLVRRMGSFALCGARWGAQYGKPMSLQANSPPQPLRFFEKNRVKLLLRFAVSTHKKGEEPCCRSYNAVIHAKMGFQRDNVPLAGVWGQRPHKNLSHTQFLRQFQQRIAVELFKAHGRGKSAAFECGNDLFLG